MRSVSYNSSNPFGLSQPGFMAASAPASGNSEPVPAAQSAPAGSPLKKATASKLDTPVSSPQPAPAKPVGDQFAKNATGEQSSETGKSSVAANPAAQAATSPESAPKTLPAEPATSFFPAALTGAVHTSAPGVEQNPAHASASWLWGAPKVAPTESNPAIVEPAVFKLATPASSSSAGDKVLPEKTLATKVTAPTTAVAPAPKLNKAHVTPENSDEAANDSSRLVAMYKMGFAVIGAGFVNTVLLGSPLAVSVGLALAFAGAQSLIALKICKEDTPVSKKLLAWSRKITHSKEDSKLSSKEKAMAPVWGTVSAALAVAEVGVNLFAMKNLHRVPWLKNLAGQSQPLQTRVNAVLAQLKAPNLSLFQKAGLHTKHSALESARILGDKATTVGNHLFVQGANATEHAKTASFVGTRQALGKLVTSEPYRYTRAFGWAAVSAFIGGYAQSLIAARVHERLELDNPFLKLQFPELSIKELKKLERQLPQALQSNPQPATAAQA